MGETHAFGALLWIEIAFILGEAEGTRLYLQNRQVQRMPSPALQI